MHDFVMSGNCIKHTFRTAFGGVFALAEYFKNFSTFLKLNNVLEHRSSKANGRFIQKKGLFSQSLNLFEIIIPHTRQT